MAFTRKKSYGSTNVDGGRSNSGRGGRGQAQAKSKGKDDNNGFIFATNFFPSKSGKSYTVFLKEEAIEVLTSAQPNDLLGITENEDGTIRLWLKEGE